ncbi:histone H4 [Parastagonospora nodorum]|nr:histone H4 [Parastagonospora nodorum]KAH5194750.1 histone H4 [Parastagonospora nodorum]KAH5604564.1 histone H4 [Parastagonospora nodorum]KAH5700357.1 histone H4 [Parastagonospora nodorum]KAH6349458.1 histone H4 [Parastagonospora nodorum]
MIWLPRRIDRSLYEQQATAWHGRLSYVAPLFTSPDTAKRKRVYAPVSCITLARAQVRLTLSPHLCTITETTTKLHRASMVNERPRQFSGVSRFAGPSRPGVPHPSSSATASLSGTPNQSRAKVLGLGLGKGSGGLGKGKGKGLKRHMKIQRDTIYGVTKGDIRRLARRGGVKRIAATIYDDIRQALKDRLRSILKDAIAVVECSGRNTISVTDIIFVLNRQGRQLYGFDPSFNGVR